MINISIDRPLIPDDAGFTHSSTSWQVSRTKDFISTDLVLESLEDTVQLVDLHTLDKIEKDQIVFARAKIHFSNGTETEWCRPITLSECQKGFKLSSTIVVTPNLFIDGTNQNINDLEEVLVRTSDFVLYAGVGKHLSTTWIVETLSGEKIWEREDDVDNLTSILLPDDILLKDRCYVIKAKHISDTNTTSNYGKLSISTGTTELESLFYI